MTVVEEHGLPLKEGKYVEISIKDQGIGIPKNHLPKIFDPYFTTKHEGSGLGLATTYSIIKNHAGYITVESDLGVGTTFYIYLLASQKETLAEKNMEEKPLVGEGKILVMDDDEVVRDVAGEILRNIGYEVEFARDGAEAIELYKQAKGSNKPFDVVLMDLTVPGGMGGKEAIRKLLEIDPEVKAIVSSGYSHEPIMSDYNQYGFSAAIAKPYKVQELSEIFHKVIMGMSG
jgi:CheY-like chemotaxis protein